MGNIVQDSTEPPRTGPIRTVEQLQSAMSWHDWTYMYSDDHRVWRAGEASLDRIREGSEWLRAQGEGNRVDELWHHYNEQYNRG